MTFVEQAVAEIQKMAADMAPAHEGLRDFQRLNLKDATQEEIATSLTVYNRRLALLDEALPTLQALMTDGYPDLPVREISAAAFADLKENTHTIEAAMSRFGSNAATTLALSSGPIEPKQ